jgi:hypothetical protein
MASMTGTDVVTYSRERPGMSMFVHDQAAPACRCQDDNQARAGRVEHWKTE